MSSRSLGVVAERVTGPFKGYYVAVYATRRARGGYVAYYKVCNGVPASYWEARCLVKGSCEGAASNAEHALDAAESIAREEIGNLPALHCLDAAREGRPFYISEWGDLLRGTFFLPSNA
jgi:hypothetical protein